MKTRSIGSAIKIRYWSSIIFFVSTIMYGMMVIFLYGKPDIGGGYGLLILLTHTISVICVLVKGETILKYADPYNFNSRSKYVYILFVEILEIVVAGCVAQLNVKFPKSFLLVGYILGVVVIFFSINILHLKIIKHYDSLVGTSKVSNMIAMYQDVKQCSEEADIEKYFKEFIKFAVYLIMLVFVYKYTLYNWLFTVIFVVVNIYIMRKYLWEGIERIIIRKCIYFGSVVCAASMGILLMKLIFDGVICLEFFEGREAQEYLMVLICFFIPISYYGAKLSVAQSRRKYQWTI